MTDDRLAEIGARALAVCEREIMIFQKRAQPGGADLVDSSVLMRIEEYRQTASWCKIGELFSGIDREFFTHARTDMLDLIAEVGRLQAQIAGMKIEATAR